MNLKPNEIAFLNYLNGLPNSTNLPDYWKYSYGVDTVKSAKKFIELNLIEYKKDYVHALSRLYAADLKNILKSNRLPVSGKKELLIKRILENVDIDFIDDILKEKNFYILTDKGIDLLEKYEICILNIKKNYCFSDIEIYQAMSLPSHYSTNDRLWNIFTERNIKFSSQKKWTSYRCNIYNMGELLYFENKYEQALNYYISVFMIDLSGMQENNYVCDLGSIYVAPALLKSIKNLVNLADISITDTKTIIDKDIACNCLPFQYYSKNTIYKILSDCLNDIEFNYKNYPFNEPSPNSKNYIYYDYSRLEYSTPKIKKKGFWAKLFGL